MPLSSAGAQLARDSVSPGSAVDGRYADRAQSSVDRLLL